MYLPTEILFQILRHLTPQEIITCTTVNKKFYQIAVDNSIWKDYFRTECKFSPDFFHTNLYKNSLLCLKTLYFKFLKLQKRDILTFSFFSSANLETTHLLSLYGDDTLLENFFSNTTPIIFSIDKSGKNPLDYAALSGNQSCFKFLSNHSSFNWDNNAYTKNLLHHAIVGGNIEIVKYLIMDKKCDINARDKINRTLLLLACTCNDYDIAQFLLSQTNNFSPNDICQLTHINALQYAAIKGNYRLFVLLDETFKFDYQHTDKDGRNVLHFAYIARNPQIIHLITNKHGSKLNVEDRHQCYPHDYPRSFKRPLIIKRQSSPDCSKAALRATNMAIGSKSF